MDIGVSGGMSLFYRLDRVESASLTEPGMRLSHLTLSLSIALIFGCTDRKKAVTPGRVRMRSPVIPVSDVLQMDNATP